VITQRKGTANLLWGSASLRGPEGPKKKEQVAIGKKKKKNPRSGSTRKSTRITRQHLVALKLNPGQEEQDAREKKRLEGRKTRKIGPKGNRRESPQ